MKALERLSQIFQASEEIPFDDLSRIVLMSDCHRGDGSWADSFLRNQDTYFAALTHYYKENYTYIELGDGDELWENRNFSDIIRVHSNVFWLLTKFFQQRRLHFIFGNHDIMKKDEQFVKKNLYRYLDQQEKEYVPLFEHIKIHEGLVLKHRITGDKIFLIHGHQVDFLNYNIWKIGRFLVRHLWKPLEVYGVNDPTRTAKNYEKKIAVDKRLTEWARTESQMLIAGHTHRPVFPEVGQTLYFNDGSCVHPRCITAIEIAEGNILLVKWSIKTRNEGTLFIGRDILAGPRKLKDFFAYKTRRLL